MFNRLINVRLKTAEDALSAGRLEEAFELASAPDLAGQKRPARLLEQLVEAFLVRGQERLLSKQFADALADFDRAARCGAPAAAVEEWRDRARRAMQDDHRLQGQKQVALSEARQKLAAGSIAGAADALAKSPIQDADGAAVVGEIERQRIRAEQLLTSARESLKDGHIAEAAKHLAAARMAHARLEGMADIERDVLVAVLKEAGESFNDGRLDRARQELSILGEIGRSNPERIEAEQALKLAQEAADALAADRYAKAGVLLGRLAQIGLKAGWISDVRKQLDAVDDQRRSLLEGPLGLLLGRNTPIDIDARTVANATLPGPARHAVAPPVIAPLRHGAPEEDGRLARRMYLRIDGVGSFLLLRGDRITIGRGGPAATADLQLISDLADRQAEIVRAGEDYFVVSASGVELAGRHVEHALLQDGDRIRFGQRVKLRFARPSLKSPTAVLELGEGVRMANDCKRVILWSGPLLMGGTRECHIPIRGANANLVLLERDGRVLLRAMGPGGRNVEVAMGMQTEFGDVRLSVQDVSKSSGVGRVIG